MAASAQPTPLSLSPMTRGNNVLISGKIVILFYTILHVYIYIYIKGNKIYIEKKKEMCDIIRKNQN